ncbi:MAG: CHAD domain-containing protein [Roseitalea porphyridii]|uniref:CHAD domain-containing protein n=1 Tax=Roseitalea porphyridii TaxID=1852022 RepID=UPI0032D8E8D9
MTYHIELDAPLDRQVALIAADQAGKARHALLGGIDDRDEAIHEARKRFKKLRGLYRLVRPCAGDFYDAENARLRDAARNLSVIRDAAALVETIDRLRDDPAHEGVVDDLDHVRARLVERRNAIAEQGGGLDDAMADAVAACEATMEAAGALDLKLDPDEAAACLADGMTKTYKRGRKALGKARKSGDPEQWHEARKRMKYHAMHCRLLRHGWPGSMRLRARQAKTIADLLGDDHDLAVLAALADDEPDQVGDKGPRASLSHAIGLTSERLRSEAVELAEPMLADKPKRLRAAVAALCRLAA